MAKPYISEDLKAFIKNQIRTVLRLEVLLLLHREQSRSFTPADVASELGFENDIAEEQLRSLAALGLLAQLNTNNARYSYHPVNIALGSMVAELAEAYSTRRVPILSLILKEPNDRIRLFAEAFRLIRGND
jgi:DNA-binding IclR family transcriptional regulator